MDIYTLTESYSKEVSGVRASYVWGLLGLELGFKDVLWLCMWFARDRKSLVLGLAMYGVY